MSIFAKLTALEHDACEFGFRWERADQIITQIRSECAEVSVHLEDKNKLKLQEEIGDLLHAALSLCVFCNLDPEVTLTQSVDKFARRLHEVKQLAQAQGLNSLTGKPFSVLMQLWDQVKKNESMPK
jgi:uncharacterized protein YabN with tetrapyrrole methylase and pyrophosphatase domain